MNTVFGEEPTAGVVGAVERERAFDPSHQRIVNNAQTEMRRQAASRLAPREVEGSSGEPGTVIAGAVGGIKWIGAAYGIKGLKMAASAAGRERDLTRNREVAGALTLCQSDALEALLAAVGGRARRRRRRPWGSDRHPVHGDTPGRARSRLRPALRALRLSASVEGPAGPGPKNYEEGPDDLAPDVLNQPPVDARHAGVHHQRQRAHHEGEGDEANEHVDRAGNQNQPNSFRPIMNSTIPIQANRILMPSSSLFV